MPTHQSRRHLDEYSVSSHHGGYAIAKGTPLPQAKVRAQAKKNLTAARKGTKPRGFSPKTGEPVHWTRDELLAETKKLWENGGREEYYRAAHPSDWKQRMAVKRQDPAARRRRIYGSDGPSVVSSVDQAVEAILKSYKTGRKVSGTKYRKDAGDGSYSAGDIIPDRTVLLADPGAALRSRLTRAAKRWEKEGKHSKRAYGADGSPSRLIKLCPEGVTGKKAAKDAGCWGSRHLRRSVNGRPVAGDYQVDGVTTGMTRAEMRKSPLWRRSKELNTGKGSRLAKGEVPPQLRQALINRRAAAGRKNAGLQMLDEQESQLRDTGKSTRYNARTEDLRKAVAKARAKAATEKAKAVRAALKKAAAKKGGSSSYSSSYGSY